MRMVDGLPPPGSDLKQVEKSLLQKYSYRVHFCSHLSARWQNSCQHHMFLWSRRELSGKMTSIVILHMIPVCRTESMFETVLRRFWYSISDQLWYGFATLRRLQKRIKRICYVFNTFLMLKMRQNIKYVPNLYMYLVRIW